MARPPVTSGGRRVDLHTHTHFSDGTLSPEALVALAVDRHLAALAITDHDSLEALPSARIAAGRNLELVPGIELSCMLDGLELHMLGYFVDPLYEPLRRRLDGFRAERLNRAIAMIAKLGELGAPIAEAEVLALAGPGVVGRPHLASALIRAGHADSIDDAFRRYLGREGRAYIPRPVFECEEAIGLLHAAGGVSVLAHPGGGLADAVIERLVECGLRGIEVWHPQHGAAAVRRFHAVATTFGLLETGGSDFHTPSRGMNLGESPVPAGVLTRLKEAAGVAG